MTNRGRAAAAATSLRYYLSADAKLDARDRRLAAAGKVARLAGHGTVSVTARVAIPRAAALGAYRLFACADDAKALRESNERNNCSAAGEPIALARAAKSLDVKPQLATDALLGTATISTAGGRVGAYGADGSIYLLIVPADALARDEQITITPVTSVGGLPFAAGLTAGVQLQPEGLQFAKPATLVISRPGKTPAAGDVIFSYAAGGRGLHLTPGFPTPPTSVLPGADPATTYFVPILHFSGIGIASATDQETATQYRRGAASAADALAQEFSHALKSGQDVAPTIERYVDDVLIPEAAAGAFSDAMYESAVRDYLQWLRLRQLLGIDDADMSAALRAQLDRVEDLLEAAWGQVVRRSEASCRKGDFSVIGRILPLERLRQLLGVGDAENEFAAVTDRCWRFELHFTARVTRDVDGGVTGLSGSEHMAWTVQAKVPLRLEGGNTLAVAAGKLVGSGPLTYSERRYDGGGLVDLGEFLGSNTCTMSFAGATQAGQLTIQDGSILTRPDGPLEPYFTFDPGDPAEAIRTVCVGSVLAGNPINSDETNLEHHFLDWWRGARAPQSIHTESDPPPDTGPWTVKLDPGRHPVVGRLQFTKSWPDQGASVTETWELVHTPLAARK